MYTTSPSTCESTGRRDRTDPRDSEVLARFTGSRDLAARIARRYARGGRHDDVMQVAEIGLWLAACRYDPDRGPFERFAVVTVAGEIKKHLRATDWSMHVTRRVQEDAINVNAALDRLTLRLERAPTTQEIAADCHLPLDRVIDASRANDARFSLPDVIDRPGGSDDATERIWLGAGVEQLADDDRRVLHLIYVRDLTQRAAADELGWSQSMVQRRLDAIHRRLRAVLEPAS